MLYVGSHLFDAQSQIFKTRLKCANFSVVIAITGRQCTLANSESTNSNYIGLGLKEFRESQNLTLKEMAELIDSSAGYISEVERGKKIPGGNMILALKQNFINLDLNKLFNIKHQNDPILQDLTVNSSATKKEEKAAMEIIQTIENGPWRDQKKIQLIQSICTIFGMKVD